MKTFESITREIDSLKKDILEISSNLIKVKSENPPGNTVAVSGLIEDILGNFGVKVRRLEGERGHVNLLSHIGSGKDGMILCGHIDTVPAGDMTKWSFDPFSGIIKEGCILGRGAADMKGGVTSIIIALKALTRFEKMLNKRISIAFFCDEETGGKYGAHWITDNQLINGDSMIIGEPSNSPTTGHSITAGERGALWARITFSGKPYHGSMPMLGDNAILKAINALEKAKRNILSKVRVPHDARSIVKRGKKIILYDNKGKENRKPHYAMDHYTLNIGIIKGGIKTNIVADKCELELDLRIPIGGNVDEAKKIINGIIKNDGYEIEYLNSNPPSYTSPSSVLVRELRESSKKIFNDKTPVICIAATLDSHYLRNMLNIPVVSYGPGYWESCHNYDEWVGINDILGCAKVYSEVVLKTSS